MKPRDIFLNALRRRPTPRPATGSATSIVTVDLMEKVGVFFPEALLDPHAELRERIRCPLVLHICGDTSDRISHIRRTGLPCFHYDSKAPTRLARALAGEDLSLMGGTSNLDVIQRGSEDAVRADVREKIECGIDIIGPECAVPLDAPCETMRLLAAEVKARGKPAAQQNGGGS